MTRVFKSGWLLLALFVAMGEAWAGSGPPTIIVSDSVELQQSLVPANAGSYIVVLPGDYPISEPLVVPEGATLQGAGVMLFEEDGVPSAFATGTETRLRSDGDSHFAGDLLTLRDGATLRGLIIEDVGSRTGNAVGIISAHSDDAVSAAIFECEIIAPGPLGIGPHGPTGRAIVAITQAGHDYAAVEAQVERSVIRDGGVFALNFGNGGRVDIALSGNRIGGLLSGAGGISRPIFGPNGLIQNEVMGATTTIRSHGNLYHGSGQEGLEGLAWQITGGGGAPLPIPGLPGSSFNTMRLYSVDDRIEGFAWGIVAIAGRRPNAFSGLSDGNLVDLHLIGLTMQTAELPDAVDLSVTGVHSASGDPVGDGNTVRLLMRGVSGSGPRANVFEHAVGLAEPGAGNRLVIVGNRTAFDRSNDGIDAAPRSEFFVSSD